MSAKKVSLYNFIPSLVGQGKEDPVHIQGKSPKAAAGEVRDSCEEKMKSLEEWEKGIQHNCVIPEDHPYRKLLKKRHVGENDSLWTLGAIAFGTGVDWIKFEEIEWEDGSKDYPEKLNKEWQTSKIR